MLSTFKLAAAGFFHTVSDAVLWPLRALRRECGVLFSHNRHTVVEIADEVLQGAENVAQVIITISGDLLPILIDMDAALTAAKSVSGVVEAIVPGAAQAIALASIAVDGGEAVLKGATTVATIVITATNDAQKLLGIAEEVKEAVKQAVPGAVVVATAIDPSTTAPVTASDGAAPTLPASPPVLN